MEVFEVRWASISFCDGAAAKTTRSRFFRRNPFNSSVFYKFSGGFSERFPVRFNDNRQGTHLE